MSAATPPRTATPVQARRDAVQPSLWDRLVDDLPGLSSEIARIQTGLTARHQPDRPPTDDDARDQAVLAQLQARQAALRERGILVTPAILREAVRRDIEDLFGIERLEVRYLLSNAERRAAPPGIAGGSEDPAAMLADFPRVRASVVNFGVPAFAGRRAGDFDHAQLARDLREVLAVFEPRLRRDSIRVTVAPGDRIGLRVRIDAELLMAPAPERLRLLTTIDLDTGSAVTVLEEA